MNTHFRSLTTSQRCHRSISTNPLVQIGLSLSSLFFLSLYLPAQAEPAPFPSISTASPVESRSFCDIFSNRQEAQAFLEHNAANAVHLDPDGDGQACNQLSTSVRTDGYRISSGSTSDGWRFEVWKSSLRSSYDSSRSQLVYYVRAWRSSQPDSLLTTRNFPSAQVAYQYFVDYLN